ncbi:hypothetical protein [Sulfurimonas hydrogeniphila]|uniref:hypothetical protein n=1 Tax=Sulfurimonas hydrogeniphila TaxID=2509341 RepID=UPI00125FB12B|nr:hypothetical protein [Sulfurimonas hydrogeniphila]
MPKIYECLKVRSQITVLQALDNNTVALSTKLHGMRIFDADDCQNKKILSIAQLNYKTTAVAVHPSENICAIANGIQIYIVSLTNKSLLQTIYTNNGTVTALHFIPDMPYIVSATNEGRVMLYRHDTQREIARLISFKHQNINAFAFHRNYMACSGYGGYVSIIHLQSHQQIKKLCVSKVAIEALCFINEQTLMLGSHDGTLYIQKLHEDEENFSLHMPFGAIKNIIYFPRTDFALISGRSKSISLVNIRSKKLVSPKYLSFGHEVDTMILTHKKKLVVALKNQQLYTITFADADDLKMCILRKDIVKAFDIIDADPRLQGTKEHKKVETLYQKLYAKAFVHLINSNKNELKKILHILQQINSKTDDIKLLFKAHKNYAAFQHFYRDKKYALAYKLSEKFAPLQHTSVYKKMEADFKKSYIFAQKQILIGNLDRAKELLLPYITILPKRPLINLLLRQNEEFLVFLKALQYKEYRTIDRLISKYEVFKDIPGYYELQKSQKMLLQNIKNTIDSANVEKALQQIKSAQLFTCNNNILQELYEYAQSVQKFLSYYANNDFKKCYELIDSDTRLQNLEITKLLEKHWQKLMNECEKHALNGDIQHIKKTLGELIYTPSRRQRTGNLLRLSFYTQIKQLINTNRFNNAENIIYSYIDIFGIDKEIRIIMNGYETYSTKKLAITHEQGEKRSRDSWFDSQIL